jgi:hypothetical protein
MDTVKRAALAALTLATLALPAHADPPPYTPADTRAAIEQAARYRGVSRGRLRCTVSYETGHTFKPYIRGRQGELGPAQLHPRGLLPAFYRMGYTNPYSPWQSMDFMARMWRAGYARHWSPVLLGLC